MANTYKIQMTADGSRPCERRTYPTLASARMALRAANGGRLHGKYIPEGPALEGWNLGKNEGCDTAVIYDPSCAEDNN